MKASVIDLHRPNRANPVAGLVALVIGVVVVIAAMQYLDVLKDHGAALDERESVIARKEAKFKTISNANRAAGDARQATLMAQQRYAAEPARDLIEGGWHPNIALLTVDIVTAARQINMQFETRSAQEALSYADWFQAQPGTESVSVKRQSEKPGPPVKSVETALQVMWKPFVAQPLASQAADAAPASAPAAASSAPTAASPATVAASSAAVAASPAPSPPPSAGQSSGGRR